MAVTWLGGKNSKPKNPSEEEIKEDNLPPKPQPKVDRRKGRSGQKPRARKVVRDKPSERTKEPKVPLQVYGAGTDPKWHTEETHAAIADYLLEADNKDPTHPKGQTIKERLVANLQGTQESLEYRRKQVLRLILRGVPKKTIADHLGISIAQVYVDCKAINAGIKQEMNTFDYQVHIGMSIAFFDECRNIALRMAGDTNEKSTTKLNALGRAIDAEKAKHEFLRNIGVYKVVNPTEPFGNMVTGSGNGSTDEQDITAFMDRVKSEIADYSVVDSVATPIEDGNPSEEGINEF